MFLLRIEDIDQSRARLDWEKLIYEDLRWLGLAWPTPVLRQSARLAAYNTALDQLWARKLLYPCACNRRDIQAAASAPQEGAPLIGPDGVVYPGTCRDTSMRTGPRPATSVLRLDMGAALAGLQGISFEETGAGPNGETGRISMDLDHLTPAVGDVVLARRDMGTSYHLSVVVDDAFQGVTHVIRGADLFEATPMHVVLQQLLGLPTPVYHHHRLIRDAEGKRLAKRDDARAIQLFRQEGWTPADIRREIGL